MDINEQMKDWNEKKSKSATDYRSSRSAFNYYFFSISTAITGYLVSTMKPEDFQVLYFKISIITIFLSAIISAINILLDLSFRKNEFTRMHYLIQQDEYNFKKEVSNLLKISNAENFLLPFNLILLSITFIFIFLWKLSVLNII